MAKILDGKALANKIKAELQEKVKSLEPQIGRSPGLAVLMVGDNPASAVYVRNKEKAAARVGITSYSKNFPVETTEKELIETIQQLNQDPRVDGILLQLPVPKHLDPTSLLYQIAPDKDVDGLHPINMGHLAREEKGIRSCTPLGVMRLLEEYGIECWGQDVLVVGKSILVGKPMSLMLLEANSTVTVAHIETRDLGAISPGADIIIVAAGCPSLITADMVKPGAVVVDVGINRITDYEGNSRLVGDVDFEGVEPVAGFITPVPGGVGPMTVAMLLQNTVDRWSSNIN